jgi:deoxyuridine 5'-triphosphate nucleotidohydrolase
MTIRYPSNHKPEPTLKVFRVRRNSKLPVRAHSSDAGMDLFYCPSDSTLGEINFMPGQNWVLPTGLKISIPEGFMLQIMNKSGIASKRTLVTGACVVDSGYDGEIFIDLHNIGNDNQRVVEGQKIAQAVLVPIVIPSLEEIEEDNIYGKPTARAGEGFGSTGDT